MKIQQDAFGDLIAMIDGIPFGAASWDDVVTALASALPGSFTAIQNANFAAAQLNSIYSSNIPEDFLLAYRDHFAAINPWERYWYNVPAGTVVSSEDVAPSSLFRNTEFYNDWLKPQSGIAAAGVKIAGDNGETIRMYLNYPMNMSPRYDMAAIRLMTQIRGSLNRTMHMLRSVRDATELAAGHAAFVARGNRAAFIVHQGCVLDDANDAAEALFRAGEAVRVQGRQVKLQDAQAQTQFSEAVARLCSGQAHEISCLPLENSQGRWLVSVAAIGTGAAYEFSGLLPLRRKVFVTIISLSPQHEASASYATTSRLFGFSRAEHAMCEHLLRGATLTEAAEALGIAKETARSRLKSTFAKAGVTRQADLLLLLVKLAQ